MRGQRAIRVVVVVVDDDDDDVTFSFILIFSDIDWPDYFEDF